MKVTIAILCLIFGTVLGSPVDRTSQVRGQVEDDSNWGEQTPSPLPPAAGPASIGILPAGPVVPSKVIYVTPVDSSEPASPAAPPTGSTKGGHQGSHYDEPKSAPRRTQYVQSVATPLGLQCYLSNPNALQSLLAPPVGQPQLVAVYDQPAPAAPEEPRPFDGQVKSDSNAGRKSRYPSPSTASRAPVAPHSVASHSIAPSAAAPAQPWFTNTQQQRYPGNKGYSVVY